MVDFLFFAFTKSVKVQTGVTASKNPPVITIKHNDNGTARTVATVLCYKLNRLILCHNIAIYLFRVGILMMKYTLTHGIRGSGSF